MKTTGTQFLRFKSEAAAQAYITAINAHSQTADKQPFAANWYPRQDIDGKWCAPFYGPPYAGTKGTLAEPVNFDKLRGDAETVDMLYWPEE